MILSLGPCVFKRVTEQSKLNSTEIRVKTSALLNRSRGQNLSKLYQSKSVFLIVQNMQALPKGLCIQAYV